MSNLNTTRTVEAWAPRYASHEDFDFIAEKGPTFSEYVTGYRPIPLAPEDDPQDGDQLFEVELTRVPVVVS